MNIVYKYTKEFSKEQLEDLFTSVGWLSGNYPDRLKKAMINCPTVISAWDGDQLVGLVNALDEYEEYLYLVLTPEKEETVYFYEKLGFEVCEGAFPMMLRTL